MKRAKKFAAIALSVLLICGVLGGCKDQSGNEVLSFQLAAAPKTLDPQLAESEAERMIVRGLYEGLLRADAAGNLVPACAERYEQDGSTYRFYLSEQAVWTSGDAVTAADFVFAFRRALSPTTAAPSAADLFAIAGAEDYNAGRAGVDDLGVRATGEKVLEITLAHPDRNFLYTLTTAVCMPCQETFFNKAGGRYGLDADHLLSNGSYKLRLWDPQGGEKFRLRLNRSAQYEGNFASRNAAVVFSLGDEAERAESLELGRVSGAVLTDFTADTAAFSDYNVSAFTDTTWVLAIHPSMSAGLRKAFLRSIDPSRYRSLLGEGATPATHLIPSDFFPADALQGYATHTPDYDPNSAQALFTEAVLALADKTFPTTTLYYYDTPLMKEIATVLAAHWQQNLGAFINIEPVATLSALRSQAAAGSYQMALLPISAGSERNAAPVFLANCLSATGLRNAAATEAIEALAAAYRTQEESALGAQLDAAQSALLKEDCLYPLFYSQTGLALAKDYETGPVTRYNGALDFSFVGTGKS